MRNYLLLIVIALFSVQFTSCGGGDTPKSDGTPKAKPQSMLKKEVDPMTVKGVGPIQSLTLDAEINEEMALAGKAVYDAKCTACHKVEKKFIGPAPTGIMERRTPEWIMNMILNPDEMVKKDPIAKKLLMEYNGSPMSNQNLTEEEARSILEYFRTL